MLCRRRALVLLPVGDQVSATDLEAV